MSDYTDISFSDVSAVIRLVREVCDRWDDPKVWREHLLSGACNLLRGNVATMIVEHGSAESNFGQLSVISAVGIAAELEEYVEPKVSSLNLRSYRNAAELLPSATSSLYAEIVSHGGVTTRRSDVTDIATHQSGRQYNEFRRRIEAADYVVSIRLVDLPRRAEAINVDRMQQASPFEPRDVAVLKLLHDEVAPLIGVRLATEEHLCRDGLSKRLRETLTLLLDGKSEKEVAASLGISTRTVHEYVAGLYAHFEVSCRAELLAYFVHRTPVPRMRGCNGDGE
ncbi:MAG: LuxR C-terminal-related transcriptional regulator [Pirellulales bacterium]